MDIEIEGDFIDQENGITTIKANIQDVLEAIGVKEIKKQLDLYEREDAEIEWFDDYDIEQEYDFRDLGEEAVTWNIQGMINNLECNGYTVFEEDGTEENGLDYIDQKRLDEITELFIRGSFQEREEIYRNATK